MGFTQLHALGRNQNFYTQRESTFGTFVVPSATTAIRVLKSTMESKVGRKDRMDARATASLQERITELIDAKWSVELYVLPSGTAGTPPDAHELLLSTFGTYANVSSTSDTYTPSDTQTSTSSAGTGSMSITREASGAFMQQMVGAWIESMKFSVKGGEEPRFTFDGGAKNLHTTGTATSSATITSGATTFTCNPTTDVYAFNSTTQTGDSAASLIYFPTDTNSGAGYTVSGINTSTGVVTFSPSLGTTQTGATLVRPFAISPTLAGSPLSSTLGSVTIDGVTQTSIIGIDIEYVNNFKAFKDIAFQTTVPDGVRGFRSVKGTLTLKARTDMIVHRGRYEQIFSTSRAIVATCGSTAGNRMVITMSNCEPDDAQVDLPEADEGTIKIPFVAKATSAGADEISLAFT